MISSLFLTIHRRAIDEAVSVLDVGCGTGDFMHQLMPKKKWIVTGIDIHAESLQQAKKLNIYAKLIKGDVSKILDNLIQEDKKFDVVFCSQVIEHLTKVQGEKMLKQFEKLAKKRIIVCTPNGYLEQPYEHELHRNHYQVHKSGWEISDFISRGYEVRGLGLNIVWGERGLGRSKNYFISILSQFVSFASSPISYFFPSIASGLICIKVKQE